MYDNQKAVDLVKEQLQELSGDLGICGYALDGNRVVYVILVLPVKGNGKIINQLEKLGWEKQQKEKIPDNRIYGDGSYKMRQRMILFLDDESASSLEWKNIFMQRFCKVD